jgi:single-strand DNA-binding protein
MNFNKAIVAGRVVHTPQLRSTPSGESVLTMGVATNRSWTDKSGQRQEQTEFHNIVVWGRQAEAVSPFLVKGSLVLIEGRLQTRSWTDKEGGQRKTTEIIAESVVLGPKPTPKVESAPKEEPSPAAESKRGERLALDGDEEDAGRPMKPLFEADEEIRPEDIPF